MRDGLDPSTRPAPCSSGPRPWRRQSVTPTAGQLPCLLPAWPVTEAQTGHGTQVLLLVGPMSPRHPIGLVRPRQSPFVGTAPRCLNYARGQPRRWQMAAHVVTRARGGRAAREGGTPKPLLPSWGGVEDTPKDPSCPGDSAGRDRACRLWFWKSLSVLVQAVSGGSRVGPHRARVGTWVLPRVDARPQPGEGSRPRPGAL